MEENEVFNSLGSLMSSEGFDSNEMIQINDEGTKIVNLESNSSNNESASEEQLNKEDLIEINSNGTFNTPSKNDNTDDGGVSNNNVTTDVTDNTDDGETTKPNSEESTNSSNEGETNVYKVLAGFLKDDGIIDELPEDLEGSPEDIKKILVSKAEGMVADWMDSLPEEVKAILEGYKEGVPLRDLIDIKSEQIELNNLTVESFEDEDNGQELAKQVMYNYLKATTKLSDEKINKQINRLADIGDLAEEAASALDELKELKREEEAELKKQVEENKRLQAERAKEYQTKLQTTIKETKEIIPGVKISDKEKQTIIKNITTPVGYDEQGRPISKVMQIRSQDPIKFEMMLNYFAEKGFFEGKFENIMQKTETKVIKNLEKAVEAQAKLKQSGKSAEHLQGSNAKDLLNSIKGLKF